MLFWIIIIDVCGFGGDFNCILELLFVVIKVFDWFIVLCWLFFILGFFGWWLDGEVEDEILGDWIGGYWFLGILGGVWVVVWNRVVFCGRGIVRFGFFCWDIW